MRVEQNGEQWETEEQQFFFGPVLFSLWCAEEKNDDNSEGHKQDGP